MANRAAVISAAKVPLEVQEVETYKPGPHEVLVKNEIIAFNPIEFNTRPFSAHPLAVLLKRLARKLRDLRLAIR
jgi:NADPH:quinone reductase-like Zn-dependent oxidoreductase